MRGIRPGPALALVALWAATASGQTPGKLEFNRDVRPILSDACFKCHGFDRNARQADLRLDLAEGAYAPHDGGTPIVPGRPERSEVFRRIAAADADERMPPADSNLSLSASQIDVIKRWIEQGAEYQPHWALIKPQAPPPPAVQAARWPRNAIDRFVLARLEAEGLTPSPEAERTTLIRRVTLDLTGLPPTLAEIDAFLADGSPDAYERVIDRLLASPRYGERMVLPWLDAARYADSNGYQSDRTRTLWPWRDWAVRAMNANMPFDQFTIEQLAGDLLPAATQDQKLATGFNRNHPLNGEGGRIAEESRVDYVMDRVETTATVWLGLTLGCCRCHDHKYDPFTQRDYYQLFAYFNNINETGTVDRGGNANPVMRVMSPKLEKKLGGFAEQVASAQARLNAALPEIDAAQAQWEQQPVDPAHWTPLDIVSSRSTAGATLSPQEDGSLLASGASPDNDVFELVARTGQGGATLLRLEALGDPSLPAGGPGRAENGNFVLTGLEGEIASLGQPAQTKPLVLRAARADFMQAGWNVEGVIDEDPKTGWAVMGAPDRVRRVAVFTLAEPLPADAELRLSLRFESVHVQHVLGRFRLSLSADAGPETSAVPAAITQILALPSEQRNEKQQEELRDYYRMQVSPRFRDLDEALRAERKQLTTFESTIPMSMAMEELPKPRDSFILVRGIYDKHADRVEPGVPASLPPLPADAPPNRLALARWLVDPANPLTARVTVNRAWQTFFGVGLVKTAEDFGVQGEPPSHPALLDWLAVRLVESGWDVKALHKLIVASATYRQSSRVTPELAERDPDNRLLSRGPRQRLSSLAIRDGALSIGGLLVERLGGPPVQPYQPAGVWEDATLGKIRYLQDHGDNLYRRSLYTFWRRTVGPTMFFDTAARNVCTVRLPHTNTPLQALILMNDITFVEAGRGLAARMLAAGATPEERLTHGFRLATARSPKPAELAALCHAVKGFLDRYRANPAAAEKLLSIGESPRAKDVDAAERAAYAAVGSLILNLDETITKE